MKVRASSLNVRSDASEFTGEKMMECKLRLQERSRVVEKKGRLKGEEMESGRRVECPSSKRV
jgi:hypothetical protein